MSDIGADQNKAEMGGEPKQGSMASKARAATEQWLSQLQDRARGFVDAERGLVKQIKDAVEAGVSIQDIRHRLESVVERLDGKSVWESILQNDRVAAIAGYRSDIEHRVENTVRRLVGSLPIVTKDEMKKTREHLEALEARLAALEA